MNTLQTRAALLEKTIQKFRTAGIPIDTDPILHGWLQAWVDGGLKMSDIAQRYQDLLKARLAGKAGAANSSATDMPSERGDNHRFMDQHELLEEVARLLADRPDGEA